VAGSLERGNYLGWLFDRGGRTVAGAGLTLLDWGPTERNPSPCRARVVNVFTSPPWRRQGLAKLLVARCLETARSRGIKQVGLSARGDVRVLYEAFGFRPARQEMVLEL
jgi:GNAT superfamily N-acetyltransferase